MGYRYPPPPLKPTNAINLEVFDSLGGFLGYKNIRSFNKVPFLADYLQKCQPTKRDTILGYLDPGRNSFQHQNLVHISVIDKSEQSHVKYFPIIATTILLVSVFFSIRHCIKHTWQNDRDQFYAPYNDAWQDDNEFKNNSLAFCLFHNQNRIMNFDNTKKYGKFVEINHFIPFDEEEVGAKERYASHALLDFLKGEIKEPKENDSLFLNAKKENKPLKFSPSASKRCLTLAERFIAITTHKISQTAPITLTQAFMTSKNFFKAVTHRAS